MLQTWWFCLLVFYIFIAINSQQICHASFIRIFYIFVRFFRFWRKKYKRKDESAKNVTRYSASNLTLQIFIYKSIIRIKTTLLNDRLFTYPKYYCVKEYILFVEYSLTLHPPVDTRWIYMKNIFNQLFHIAFRVIWHPEK